MKTVGFLLFVLMMQGCLIYQPYYKDSEWWYFEEWDTNQDSKLDKNEFEAGLDKYRKKKKDQQKLDSTTFVIVDEDHDNEVSAIEFYKWEVSL